MTLQWRHNERHGVSKHRRLYCLFNCRFSRRSKKTSKPRVTGLCAGNSPWSVNSLHKRPVTRKMFPFYDVIMKDPMNKTLVSNYNQCSQWLINMLVSSYWVIDGPWKQGAVSIRKTVLPGMAIPMLKIRRPNGRLIFNMEIAIRR